MLLVWVLVLLEVFKPKSYQDHEGRGKKEEEVVYLFFLPFMIFYNLSKQDECYRFPETSFINLSVLSNF
jgi:hypothetical protein